MEKQMEICERFAGKHIVKRNGSVKSFDVTKIVSAVTRAGKATGEFGEAKALDLVCAYGLPRLDGKSTLCIARPARRLATPSRAGSTSKAPSTNTSTRSTGASTRTPTRAIRSAASS